MAMLLLQAEPDSLQAGLVATIVALRACLAKAGRTNSL
jgi:hypothetical protein